MTDTSPLPPSLPVRRAFAIDPVMYGQEWETQDGRSFIAEYDGVRIQALDVNGAPVVSILQTPEAAIALAIIIQDTAVKAIKASVGDDGKPPTPLERMDRINNAYKIAGR